MAECVETVDVYGPTVNFYPAWDGGARSIVEFDGDCYFGFATNTSTVGAVVGLNTADVGYSFAEITHGFRFDRGDFWIMENGVNKQGPFPFANTDRFYIFRVGTEVLYIHKDDTDLTVPVVDPRYPGVYLPDPITYISTAPSTGTVFLDSSLYQFNDYVYNEEGGEIWLPSLSFVSEEGNEAVGLGQLPFSMFAVADSTGAIGSGRLGFTVSGNVPTPTEGTGQLPFIAKGKADGTIAVEDFTIGSGQLPFGGGLGGGKVGYDGIAGTSGGAIGTGILPFSMAGTAYKANFVYGYGFLPFRADGLTDDTVGLETVARGDLPFLGLGISLGFYDNYFNIPFPTFGVEVQRFEEELSDSMIIIPSLAEGLVKIALLSDSFQLTAPIMANYAFNIGERIVLVEELQQFSQQAVELLDSFGITTRQQIALAVNLSETMLGTGTFNVSTALEIADQLVATGTVETFYQATELLASSMALTDLTQAAFAVTVADGMALSEEILTRLALQAMLNDAMTLTDSTENQLYLMAVFEDSLEISDSQELTARYFAELLDSAVIYTLVRTPAELAQGWVMNTEGSQPISEYDNYTFSSLAYGPRGTIGTTDEGVYDMSGADDAGADIDAALTSMVLDFGTSRMKRMSAAWVGYKADGELVLKVRAVDVDVLVEYCFVGRAVEGVPAPQENRFKLGKGLRSRYWQFELVNKDGADFEVDQVELYPIRLDRRV